VISARSAAWYKYPAAFAWRYSKPPVERTPPPVGTPSHIRDDDMRVQQRVARPRRPMLEPRRTESFPAIRGLSSSATPNPARVALEVSKCLLNRGAVRRTQLTDDRAVRNAKQHADGLRGAERQVESRNGLGRHRLAQPLSGRRIPALEQPDDLDLLDVAVQAECPGAVAVPLTRRLAFTGVVVLRAARDLVDVATPGSRAGGKLSDGEHRRLSC
jgi:hypothetical protein